MSRILTAHRPDGSAVTVPCSSRGALLRGERAGRCGCRRSWRSEPWCRAGTAERAAGTVRSHSSRTRRSRVGTDRAASWSPSASGSPAVVNGPTVATPSAPVPGVDRRARDRLPVLAVDHAAVTVGRPRRAGPVSLSSGSTAIGDANRTSSPVEIGRARADAGERAVLELGERTWWPGRTQPTGPRSALSRAAEAVEPCPAGSRARPYRRPGDVAPRVGGGRARCRRSRRAAHWCGPCGAAREVERPDVGRHRSLEQRAAGPFDAHR